MKYFFILGNHPVLSVAEISAVFKEEKMRGELAERNVFVLETEKEIDCESLIKKIGGTVKIGKIIAEIDAGKNIAKKLAAILEKQKKEKINFGVSYYGDKNFKVRKIAKQIKEYLNTKGIKARLARGKNIDEPLSSVAVDKNKLISKGIEAVVIDHPLAPSYPRRGNRKANFLIGKTLAVQPFKELSFRDYNRPARDDRSGMLPPKLAQIMLNLANYNPSASPLILRGEKNRNKVIYDPFCGSGTILTEAMLMGCRTIIGSDISAKAVKNTQENIEWIKEKYNLKNINANIFQLDSAKISEYLRKPIVDAIVTEPYLGPQRGKININKVKKELENLYADSLREFEKILKPDGKVVILWPVFNLRRSSQIKPHKAIGMATGQARISADRKSQIDLGKKQINADSMNGLNPNLGRFKIINPLPEDLRKNENIKLTNRNTIIYGRPGQRVWREIVVLGLEDIL